MKIVFICRVQCTGYVMKTLLQEPNKALILKDAKLLNSINTQSSHNHDNNIDYNPDENIILNDKKSENDLHWKYFDEVLAFDTSFDFL